MVAMQDLYDKAAWRPLADQNTEPIIGIPRVLIWHTMIGSLKGTDSMFRRDGYTGTESTFGLGHTIDGSALNGRFWQWQKLSRQADAQMAGNLFATSIECSDGGKIVPFSKKQIVASIEIGVWWCKQTGNPAAKATRWDGHGLGYHRMFKQWAPDARSCPGDPRVRQLETEIWPEIALRLGGSVVHPTPTTPSTAPAFPLPDGWYFGSKSGPKQSVSGYYSHRADLKKWQQQMRYRGWSLTADGLYGNETERVTKQFQNEKGLHVSGRIDRVTWMTAWTARVT